MAEKKWDGKTKGSLWGYRFFIFLIHYLGLNIAYFFCFWISLWYLFFNSKARKGVMQFYQKGLGYSSWSAFWNARKNFYQFGTTLIDRVAFKTKHKTKFNYHFNLEEILIEMAKSGKGGFLFSAHLGNWENAGNLIKERITSKINVVMLDEEVQKIKNYLQKEVGESDYQLIAIKDDFSHLIAIHAALQRNELVAMHADRLFEGAKKVKLPFMKSFAEFPLGPFTMAIKFKAPVTFVYAIKSASYTYQLSATPVMHFDSVADLAQAYAKELEKMATSNPNQWFNFYPYFVS